MAGYTFIDMVTDSHRRQTEYRYFAGFSEYPIDDRALQRLRFATADDGAGDIMQPTSEVKHSSLAKRVTYALALGLGLMPAAAAADATAAMNNARNFRTHLSGDEEVPPVETKAQGQAIFQLSRDEDSLRYKLIVANIEEVVAAHIHCAPAGVNGPVGVTLFMGGPESPNGILAQDTITAPDLGNACGWTDLESVAAAMRTGDTYVNVHTVANPPGEIRGQIR